MALLAADKLTDGLLDPPSDDPKMSVFTVIGALDTCVMEVPASSSSVAFGKFMIPGLRVIAVPACKVSLLADAELRCQLV